jgi:hypothetical protein
MFREEQMANILALYTCGTLKPFRRPTTMVFCDRQRVMTMDMNAAGFDVAGSVPFFFDVAREPVLQIARHPNNSSFRTWRDAKCGVGSIPEQEHKTRNCGCLETTLGNNVESKMFVSVCIPREFVLPPQTEEPYADRLETLNNASQRYLNTSLTYVGIVSEIGTAVPRMTRRSALGRVEREEVMVYKSFGAEFNFREKPEALKAVLCQVRRPELNHFWPSLADPDKQENSGPENWPRFHSKGR